MKVKKVRLELFNFGFNYFAFTNPFMNFFMPVPQYSFMNFGINYPVKYDNSIFQTFRNNMTYNNTKGELLVKNAIAGTPETPPDPPLCARYFNNALIKTGIGAFSNANGEQTKYELRNNLNFKEVKVDSSKLKNLPAGSTIVYDANDSGVDEDGNPFKIGKFGHVVIAKGDGTGISDRFESTILPSDNAYVFIPV